MILVCLTAQRCQMVFQDEFTSNMTVYMTNIALEMID